MADSIFGCIKEIGKCLLSQCLWPPVKCHIDYWWCFDNNIQGLRDGVRDLDREMYDINKKIEEARLHTKTLRPGVEDWSNKGTEKLVEARRILQDDNIPKVWNLILRYSVGKSAKKTAEEIAKHQNEGNFNPISYPAPPAAMGSTSHRPTMDFESRKRIEEDIIESLKNSSMIGICGMGGVGKTTMVERIKNRVREEKLFDEVVMVVVSQQKDVSKIQEEIAELLGMKFDVKFMSARANKLHTRLMDDKRKIIIFDDVWESLNLKDLGVPFESGYERCKILLTTRFKDICEKMEAQKVIAMEVLTKEEAWSLFKEKAGDYVEDSDLHTVAKDVVAECKGLPIALVTVGKALQNKRISIWEDSLSQLRGSNPIDFPEVLTDVYKPLKLSYDYLDNEREKSLFLLCCLFPEDYNIPLEQLTWYSMGLQIFDKMSIAEARNRTHRLVENLKSRFLLFNDHEEYYTEEDYDEEYHVRMHDVVRDVAIYIGSKERHGFLTSLEVTSMDSLREESSLNCKWMSVSISNERINLPLGLHFPNLRLFMMLKSTSDISFEGMKDLNVLYFSKLKSSPPTMGLLKNLRTLHLHRCAVENISVIGESASLEILSCSWCENIEELPIEIGRLNRLRLLDLCDCYNLKTIAFGVISSFVLLEELKMLRSFSNWEAEEKGKERRNAALTELESLPNLTCLEIEISDWNLAAQEICLSHKLVKYCINIYNKYFYLDNRVHEKGMCLTLPRRITVGKWIHILVRNTEVLELDGDGSNNFNLAEIETLRNLKLKNCSTVKKLVNTIDCKFGTPNQNVSLCNLTSIQIWNCSNLQYLFPVWMARNLLQLEVLEIESCDTMEYVFWNEIKSITEIEFPKLKELTLIYLQNLTVFCQGVENIQFPKLIEVKIESLPKLNSIQFPLNSEPPQDYSSFHFLCNQKVETGGLNSLTINNLKDNISNIWCHHISINFFSNLKELNISNLNGIRNLMSSSIAKNLVSLKSLSIESCLEMVEVIEDKEEVVETQNVSLCNLTTISILECSNLQYLFSPNQNVSLCNLTSIQIWNCSNLQHLFSVSMAMNLLQLEMLEIECCDTMEQVFWNEINSINEIEFPKLKKLKLGYLQNLTDFCQGVESIQFLKLIEMKIQSLPKLNSEPPQDDSSFHFLCNQKVEIDGLNSLTINNLKDSISNIWCHHIPINFFSNLKELKISNLNGIRNLMSSSIAKNLVSLKYLSIKSCQEMVEVIEDEEDVVNLALFPALEWLEIKNLLKLRSFCQWKHAFELPLLKYVEIVDCPRMEIFTLGLLSTPYIYKFAINGESIYYTKDLNVAIHHFKIKANEGEGSSMSRERY